MDNLKGFVWSIITSFLGPNKSCKFVIQDKDVFIARCPLQIFQSSHDQDFLSPLIEETLFAHHELYGCSTLSLLAMWYLWYEEFKHALEEGCEMQDIMIHSQDILELVISSLSTISINIDSLLVPPKCNHKRITREVQCPKLNAFGQIPVTIQYSSRHFSPSQSALHSKDEKEQKKISEFDENSLKMLMQRLDHDEDDKVSHLVLECWKKQISFTGCLEFQSEGLVICPIVLPSSKSTVVDGLVLKCDSNYACSGSSQNRENINMSRTLIIEGSVTFEYVHLGFSSKVLISLEKTPDSSISEKEKWRKKCCEFLLQLNIDVLLVRDDVDPEIAIFCSSHSILVLSHVQSQVFKILCCTLQYSPCKYVWDCNEDCILKSLAIKAWKLCDTLSCDEQYFHCMVSSTNKVLLQTIVLCHFSKAVLKMTEHQIQHLVSRLNLSFKSKKLLPGREVEEWCSDFLKKSCQNNEISSPKSRITLALANGYLNYSKIVSSKKTLSTKPATRTLDEMSSKISAWRSALSLVLLILQCDAAIVNGVSDIAKQTYLFNGSL